MKKTRYTEQHIAFALRQAEQGTAAEEIIRRLGVSEATFYRWKKKFSGMGAGTDGFADLPELDDLGTPLEIPIDRVPQPMAPVSNKGRQQHNAIEGRDIAGIFPSRDGLAETSLVTLSTAK